MSKTRTASESVAVSVTSQTAKTRLASESVTAAVINQVALVREASLSVSVAVRKIPPNQSGITVALRR